MTASGPQAASPPPPRRRRLARVAAALLAAALALALVEGVLALAGLPRPRGLSPEVLGEAENVLDARIYESDRNLIWRLRASATIDAPDDGYRAVRTDARGLRGTRGDDEIARSRLRVLCMGDSVTFGLALADDETFPARLEQALAARLPDAAPVVVNAGQPGHSSVQGLRLLEELAPLAPDVVVWWFGMNDAKPALGAPDATLKTPGSSDVGPRGGWRTLRIVRFAESLATDVRGDPTRASSEDVRAAVEALQRRAARGGPTPLFVRCPSRLAEKVAQYDALVAAARGGGASRVELATDAASEYVVADAAAAELVRVEDRPGGSTAVFGPGRRGRVELALEDVVRRRDAVERWRRAVDALVAEMPAGALSYDDLFDGAAPADVFMDDCHLSAKGARTAAESLAARIVEIAARRGPR